MIWIPQMTYYLYFNYLSVAIKITEYCKWNIWFIGIDYSARNPVPAAVFACLLRSHWFRFYPVYIFHSLLPYSGLYTSSCLTLSLFTLLPTVHPLHLLFITPSPTSSPPSISFGLCYRFPFLLPCPLVLPPSIPFFEQEVLSLHGTWEGECSSGREHVEDTGTAALERDFQGVTVTLFV